MTIDPNPRVVERRTSPADARDSVEVVEIRESISVTIERIRSLQAAYESTRTA